MRFSSFLLLGNALLLGTACSSSSTVAEASDASTDGSSSHDAPSADSPSSDAPATDAPASDAPASASCGTCPSSAPVCYHVNAHDGSHIVAAECIPMPDACSATPTCDCARTAIAASWHAEAGVDSGLPRCPGNGMLYCDGSEGPLTVRCNPP